MDKAKKNRLKKYVSWACLAALVALLAVMPLLAQNEEEADGPKASILEDTVKTGSIETALRGGGTLEAGNAMDITLPSGVKITEFLVKNGDTVTEGTPLATVDKVSLMNAIVEVQDTLDYLQEKIADASDDTVSSTIAATAGGRIKEVYASAGDSVQDVMLEHGALAVLSLDSLMAVKIERNMDLAAGDSVCVTFGDGTEVNGRVESSLNGTVIVTVEDEEYAVGEKVTVTTEDGDRIGSGELYVHNAWRATAFSGTISTVYAKENTNVYNGSTLFTLTETDFKGNLDSMANLHREYEELLQDMFRMYESGVITAPCDGMVSGVDEDSAFLLSALEGEQGWFVDLLDNTTQDGEEKGWTVMLLSGDIQCAKSAEKGVCQASRHEEGCYYYCTGTSSCTATTHNSNCYYYCNGSENCTAKEHNLNCLKLCVSSDGTVDCPNAEGYHKADCIEKCESCTEIDKCPATGAHKTDCIESCIPSDGSTTCPATGTHKEECLFRCDKTETCTATKHHYPTCLTLCTANDDCTADNHKANCPMANLIYYAYAGRVDQVGLTEVIVYKDTATRYRVSPGSSGWTLLEPTQLKTDLMITQTKEPVSNPSKYKAGDVILFWTGYRDGKAVKTGSAVYTNIGSTSTMPGSGGMTGGMDLSGMLSGMMGSMGSMSGMMGSYGSMGGSSMGTDFELFDLDGEVLMTVTERDVMSLTITLDEKDISKVSVGQTAQLEVTALKGQIFDAEVTDVGTIGTNNGGSSKFTAELTVPLDENMLAGMNATAIIPLYTKMDVLTIPVAALVETETGTFVYTTLDPETGEPATPVEVTTGVSDGENVEILSGLNVGDKFYYSYYDTLELDHTARAERGFSFG